MDEILTTHVGADFDALGAMLAARKLHPEARLYFPGSREESVRRMLDSGLGTSLGFEEVKAKEIDPERLRRVVLVDVRQRDRIGAVAGWLEGRPEIEVWAYDHHQADVGDVEVAGGIVDPEAGSTCTILAEIFAERGTELAPSEATAMLLGVYEDTGSLTYAGAGPRDLRAAAWLVEQGGDLAAVRRWAIQRLDPERLQILHRMTQVLDVHRLRGHRVGTLALELGEYVDELAPLVNRCLEIFELPLLFAVFGEGDRVVLIARGDVAQVHLGQLLERFAEGGGHRTAASARVKGVTPLEARERLLAFLAEELPPSARAADLMVTTVYTVAGEATVAAAKEHLVARQVNAAAVADARGRVVGVVTRQILDASLQHGLGERSVATVADRDVQWVDPDAPAETVGELMLGRHPRLVLVGDRETGRPRGVVTRMQLLRHLHGRLREEGRAIDSRLARLPEERESARQLLDERLPPGLARRVRTAAEVSRRYQIPVYLVGGLVRDLLLERENRDLDLVVEGDGPHFARLLAGELGGRVRVHEAFLTAVVVAPDGLHVDVATARSERYREPAALPEVEGSALRQDLYRRDFTINALAIRLGPEESPELVDYFGGRRDLEQGVLRVLHSLSFIDDPTRVLRAVRFAVRLGFSISPETRHLVDVALAEGVFDRLSGARLRGELALLLGEAALVVRGFELLNDFDLLAVLHPDLALAPELRELLQRVVAAWDWVQVEGLDEPPTALWRLVLLAVVDVAGPVGPGGGAALAERLALAGDDRELLTRGPERVAAARERLTVEELSPSAVSEALARLSGEEILLLVASDRPRVRDRARRELDHSRKLRLAVSGGDLVARGVSPGPWIGTALEATRAARLDGEIGPDDELETALGHARAAQERNGEPG